MDIQIAQEQIWMVVVGFIIAFVLAFGIGANDVANSFGTSVGSKVLSLRTACILASIFETAGAVFLGAKVSDTIRKGIIDPSQYENNTDLLLVGNVAALSGSCIWLLTATVLRLPVSATHSIVGATVGFALVAKGSSGINWTKLGAIIGSWFVSPVLAGLVSTGIFFFCRYFILSKPKPLEPGLKFLPVFYAITIVINAFSVFYDGPEKFHFDKIPLWGVFIISFGLGVICALIVRFIVVPWQRKRITDDLRKDEQERAVYEIAAAEEAAEDEVKLKFKENSASYSVSGQVIVDITHPRTDTKLTAPKISKNEDAPLMDNEYNLGTCTPNKSPSDETANLDVKPKELEEALNANATSVEIVDPATLKRKNSTQEEEEIARGRGAIQDGPETAKLFSFLQILTAIFGAFAHGGNDVSNAIGPLVSLWLGATEGTVKSKAATPIWILFYGGFGISIGLWVLGRRVIKTLGEDLTKITPSSGFCIEIGSALTVLIASNIGIPISTTHCKVGSVVCVGRFRSKENVDWSIFRNIVLAWLVTLPVSGGISAAIMKGLMLTVAR